MAATNIQKRSMTENGLFTMPEALERLPVGLTKLYELIDEGVIERVKVGRKSLIRGASIDRYNKALLGHPESAVDLVYDDDSIELRLVEALEGGLIDTNDDNGVIILKSGERITRIARVVDVERGIVRVAIPNARQSGLKSHASIMISQIAAVLW